MTFAIFKAQWLRVLAVLFMISVTSSVQAAQDAANFTLFDEHGRAVELHYHRLASAVVLMTHRIDTTALASR